MLCTFKSLQSVIEPICRRCSLLCATKKTGGFGKLCEHHRLQNAANAMRHYKKKKAALAASDDGVGFNVAVLQHMKHKHGYNGMPFVAGKSL